jgi:CHAD domain-containing protein
VNGLSAETQPWLAARGLLRDRCDEFHLQLTRVRESFEAEAIHDLRVASRRLREGLALFAGCFRKKQLAPLRGELKGLTSLLGAIRNCDEALLFFVALAGDLPAQDAAAVRTLASELEGEREGERRVVRRELKKIDVSALLERMDGLCGSPRLFNPDADCLFEPFALTMTGALAVRDEALRLLAPEALVRENVAAQHRLRIAVKRFRYRMEFLAPLGAGGYGELYAAVKEYQELLGHLHDLDVFAAIAREKIPAGEPRSRVLAAIADRRDRLFDDFTAQYARQPLESLGERVRGLL